MPKENKIELEIKSIGKNNGFEFGIDQFKNAYKRVIGNISWERIFEYRRKTQTVKSNSKEIKIIADVGIFYFSMDSKGKFWKQFKNCPWTEVTNGEEKPKYFLHDIIATKGNYYWEKHKKNKVIIKRQVDTSLLGEIERKKEYYHFIHNKKGRHIEEVKRIQREEEKQAKRIQREEEEQEYLRKKKVKENILFFGRK